MNKKQSRRTFLSQATLFTTGLPLIGLGGLAPRGQGSERDTDEQIGDDAVGPAYKIERSAQGYEITAGTLTRSLVCQNDQLHTQRLAVGGENILSGISRDFKVVIYQAIPDRAPKGIIPGEYPVILWPGGDAASEAHLQEDLTWQELATVDGDKLSSYSSISYAAISTPTAGVTRLTLRASRMAAGPLQGVSITLHYEIYAGFPVIRKWIELTNNSSHWLKVGQMMIDDVHISGDFMTTTPLTPQERGAGCSIMAYSDHEHSRGVIAVSEVPSAIRMIAAGGAMGYQPENFEWVLGPGESFVSEPVFMFGFEGPVNKTISGVSTPLDRVVERPFKAFIEHHLGIRGDSKKLPVPLWCSWTHFLGEVNDKNMREQAGLAAEAGIGGFLIDSGWGAGAIPNRKKFPDFGATARAITDHGLKFGLWISDYRSKGMEDFKAIPDGSSLPGIKRGNSYGMSFASRWRDYYANDLINLNDQYGVSYVKQDLSVIKFGDIAASHESRTLKESLLRGIRGLFAANDRVAEKAPEMVTEITHEMYWGTPGVPCDLAALKHAWTFHIPPNEYLGAGKTGERPSAAWTFDPLKLRSELIAGCAHARARFFAHRGLPLYCLEFYSASMVNIKGSLTPRVQDRQLCSWLMGAPSVFAGDLSSLTAENIAHYKKRFDLLKRLQEAYDIYHYFQYSGVPTPTETDWHWWGKLNPEGRGVVVIVRGNGGSGSRKINIPWVLAGKTYEVRGLFARKKFGRFTGKQLSKGTLRLDLPVYGQEILELS